MHNFCSLSFIAQLLKEVKEQPRDDAEVERKEEGGIDEVFAEKSSSSDEEEDLTESGKLISLYDCSSKN